MLWSTRLEMEERLQEGAAWIAAAVVGVGVAFSLTIIFLSVGMKLILVGAALGASGWGLARLLPSFYKFHTICCPRCYTEHQVCHQTIKFSCTGCGKSLHGHGFWKNGTEKGKRRVLISGHKFTSIIEKNKESEKKTIVQ